MNPLLDLVAVTCCGRYGGTHSLSVTFGLVSRLFHFSISALPRLAAINARDLCMDRWWIATPIRTRRLVLYSRRFAS
jgi:hypothetical protein